MSKKFAASICRKFLLDEKRKQRICNYDFFEKSSHLIRLVNLEKMISIKSCHNTALVHISKIKNDIEYTVKIGYPCFIENGKGMIFLNNRWLEREITDLEKYQVLPYFFNKRHLECFIVFENETPLRELPIQWKKYSRLSPAKNNMEKGKNNA